MMSANRTVSKAKLRVELAQRGMAQWKVALAAGYRPSSFSDWLRGARPEPADFAERIEQALGLAPGTLTEEVAQEELARPTPRRVA